MKKIEAILYSYKNKNLKLVVDALLSKTKNEISVNVLDQNSIDRSKVFLDSRIKYTHIIWDRIDSPNEKRVSCIDDSEADYILQISDDCLVSDSWDLDLIKFIEKENCIVSGNEFVELLKNDLFFLGKNYKPSNSFQKTNYVSRNFIFSKSKIWKTVQYPYELKFNGEEELLSLNFFKRGFDVYCAPSALYKDLGLKTLERLYVPFSKDHNYNTFVEQINGTRNNDSKGMQRTTADFLNFHNLSGLTLLPLPYPTNDVSYDHYGLDFQDVDARKFISGTKLIS
jgi:hypothetical protein